MKRIFIYSSRWRITPPCEVVWLHGWLLPPGGATLQQSRYYFDGVAMAMKTEPHTQIQEMQEQKCSLLLCEICYKEKCGFQLINTWLYLCVKDRHNSVFRFSHVLSFPAHLDMRICKKKQNIFKKRKKKKKKTKWWWIFKLKHLSQTKRHLKASSSLNSDWISLKTSKELKWFHPLEANQIAPSLVVATTCYNYYKITWCGPLTNTNVIFPSLIHSF